MKKYIVLLATTLALLLGVPQPAFSAGNSYYVSPSGNDANPGTAAQPWKTIQKAANTMVAGDTGTVLAGMYNERVQVARSGVSGAPITFQANGTVVMQGFTVKTNYITIAGFEITNTPKNLNTDYYTEGVGIYVVSGVNHCVIENNYVHYANTGGIVLYSVKGIATPTSDCIVRGNRLAYNQGLGLDIQGRNHLVENNEIWGTLQHHPDKKIASWDDADGIHFHGAGHIFRGNYIHDIPYGDIYLNGVKIGSTPDSHTDCFQSWSASDVEPGSNILFEKNRCINAYTVSASASTHAMMIGAGVNLTIRNNIFKTYSGIFADNGSTGLVIANNVIASNVTLTTANNPEGIALGNTGSVIIKDDIFYDLPGQIIWLNDAASLTGLSGGNNIMYRSDGKPLWTSSYPRTGDLWGVNPLFVNPAALDFHLQSVSPAIDAGVNVGVLDDFDGQPRPQGKADDAGAYEVRSAQSAMNLFLPMVKKP